MNVESFLKERKSVREFKKRGLSASEISSVNGIISSVNEEVPEGVKFSLYENGTMLAEQLEGKGGYSGVMIMAPHYITLGLLSENPKNIMAGAYYMEKIVTDLSSLDIASCWVSLHQASPELKKELFSSDLGEVNFVLAIGKAKGKSIFEAEVFSDRKPVSEVVYDGEWGKGIEDFALKSRGLGQLFNFVRYAPSDANRQPWRYLITDKDIKLFIEDFDTNPARLMDAGIAMYYFEALASRIGNQHKWVLCDLDGAERQGSFTHIASYEL